MHESTNSLTDLMQYFGMDMNNEDDVHDFKVFWASLDWHERRYYRTTRLASLKKAVSL